MMLVALGLDKEMGLTLPGIVEFGEYVLSFGRSSATRSLAMQFAKL